jgi:selenocysteine lyase/cysteine desulfurase
MWRTLGDLRESVRSKLADLAGTSPEELAIVRNSTEALEALILGLDMKAGDEFLTTDQDYPNMMHALHQRERREGVVIKKIKVPVPTTTLDEIAHRYEEAITPRTKAILICHMINLTGHIQPVKAVADIAHSRGIPVICDGAHSFGCLDFRIPDLGADYYGTSLHKWLCAPFGSGLLYIRKEKIDSVWSLFGSPVEDKDKITKFEHIGTRSFPIELGIGHAIDFHNQIGSARKEARLRYLKDYWANQVKVMPRVFFNTSLKREHSCGIANFGIEGMTAEELATKLLRDHKIFTVAIDHEDVKGIRVSPHIYTTLKDLDRFVEAVHGIINE